MEASNLLTAVCLGSLTSHFKPLDTLTSSCSLDTFSSLSPAEILGLFDLDAESCWPKLETTGILGMGDGVFLNSAAEDCRPNPELLGIFGMGDGVDLNSDGENCFPCPELLCKLVAGELTAGTGCGTGPELTLMLCGANDCCGNPGPG